jgi:hypothetical protein
MALASKFEMHMSFDLANHFWEFILYVSVPNAQKYPFVYVFGSVVVQQILEITLMPVNRGWII